MDQAGAVGGVEGEKEFAEDAADEGRREGRRDEGTEGRRGIRTMADREVARYVLADHFRETWAVDVLHGDVVDATLAADGVHRHDVRVLEGGGGLRLTLEAGQGGGVAGQLGPQQLQRDGPVQALFVRFEDNPHPAAAEDAVNPIRPQLSAVRSVAGLCQQAAADELVEWPPVAAQVAQHGEMRAKLVRQIRVLAENLRVGDDFAARTSRANGIENLADAHVAAVALDHRFGVRHLSYALPELVID